MISPQNYADCHKVSCRDSTRCLEENISKLTWNNERTNDLSIIDIGCGDGYITTEILPKYFPTGFKQLVGSDVNEKMIQFATKHHASERIKFQVFDIVGDVPEQFRGHFDHAFSFYALHWVQDQEKAFCNIYELLAPGGSILLTIIGNQQIIYNVYRIMSRSTKWHKWLKNVEDIVSPYHDCVDPETKIEKTLINIGFTDVKVVCNKISYCMESAQEFKKFVRSINAFHIPEDLFDDYLNELIQIGQNMGYLDENYRYYYHSIMVCGKKSKK